MRHFILAFHGILSGCLLFAGAAFAAESAPTLDSLQGKWSTVRTNQQGEKFTQAIEFKRDKLTFQLRSENNEVRFVAKGNITLEKMGPFNVFHLTEMEAGRSMDELQFVDDPRAYVFSLRDDKLSIASGFDRQRKNEPPRADIYVRDQDQAAASSGAEGFVGTWKIEFTYNEQTRDYELRLEQAEGKLQGTMISSRSGEHKIRLVTVKDNQLTMEWDREIDNNPATLVIVGTRTGNELSGTVVVKDHEEEYKGRWKATK